MESVEKCVGDEHWEMEQSTNNNKPKKLRKKYLKKTGLCQKGRPTLLTELFWPYDILPPIIKKLKNREIVENKKNKYVRYEKASKTPILVYWDSPIYEIWLKVKSQIV